jgi:DNA-directed RNA polymerase subunit RPC12/RpoP
LSGDPVFPEDVLEFATRCVRNPIAWGKLDSKGKFHGVKREVKNELGQAYKAECWQDWCTADHRFDDWELRIWEFPMEGHTYIMGVDVAEGLGGKHDYSVISIIRLGKQANADVQVAVWRSNTVNHYELAIKVVHLGSWYNTAQACVEYNIYQTCGDAVRIQYNYPNLHRWKHLDHQQINSTSWHWITNGNTKPKLWGDMVRRLRAQLFWPRSDNLIEEMKRFQKSDEDSDKKAEAERGCFVAGSKVITKGFIPVPIEKIKPGDEVLTVSGTFEKVIRTTCRAYSGDLHEVSVTGVPRTIECTSEHPFFAKKRNGGQTLISAVENNEPEWIEAKHLRQGDLCCIPQAVTHRMELPDDESGKQKIQVHQRDQKFYTPINWIKKKPVRDLPVFNLEVAGDHTYTIEGVGVHNSHDDELMATFIASYCAHETDYDATLGYNIIRGTRDETAQRIWHITCLRCAYEFDDDELPNGRNLRCEQCSCILLKARKNGESVTSVAKIDLIKMEEASTGPETPDYDSL